MGRRRKIIDDDGDSSDGERDDRNGADGAFDPDNPDLAEEAALFANPYSRHKTRSKEDMLYGVFGEDDDDERPRKGGGSRPQGSSSRYTAGVAFVTGQKRPSESIGEDDDDNDSSEADMEVDDRDQGGDQMDLDDDSTAKPGLGAAYPEDEVDDVRPSFGRGSFGIGFGASANDDLSERSSNSRSGLGSASTGSGLGFTPTASRGLGFTPSARGGIGSAELPTSFGTKKPKSGKARQRASSPGGGTSSSRQQPVDKAFGKFDTKGVASKMMEAMGWKKGMGLGKDNEGIAAPIDVKLRPNRAGLGMVDERTDALKRAQKDREFEESTREPEPAEKPAVRTGQWKQSATSARKKKPQPPAFKSAQELIAEQAAAPITAGGATQATKILDMTGKQVRELAHVSEAGLAQSAAFEVTAMRLPELRNNVRLLADLAQQDLLHVGRQIRIEQTRQTQLRAQEDKVARQAEEEQSRVVRLTAVVEIAHECQVFSQKFMHGVEDLTLEALSRTFSGPFHRLQAEYFAEYKQYRLDELVVAALAPVMKRLLADWDPLTDPTFAADVFRQWKQLLRFESGIESKRRGMDFDVQTRNMTAYENMMYGIWLPKVRQAINNRWDPKQPEPAVALLEAWYPPTPKAKRRRSAEAEEDDDLDASRLLPSWLYYNILEQLILPKLSRSVDAWNPTTDPIPVHVWLHPWLPHLDDRLDAIHTAVRHKLNVMWRERRWLPSDPSALAALKPWIDVFKTADMDSLIVKAVLPKLVESLQKDLVINPAAQDLAPLQNVLAWRPVIPVHLLVHLLETEFFPKWHTVLWQWLSAPGANFEEIAEWYRTWKTRAFDRELLMEAGIAVQFKAGLDMMNRAIAMGGAKGEMPPAPPPIASISETAAAGGRVGASSGRRTATGFTAAPMSAADSFKSYVEDEASKRDMLFAPANRVHPTTGKALFRLAPAAQAAHGHGGIVCYIEEGVLFVEDASETDPKLHWKAVEVEAALDMAAKKPKR